MIDIDCLMQVQAAVRAVVPDAMVSILPSDNGMVRLTAVSGFVSSTWGTSPVLLQQHPEVASRELATRLERRLGQAEAQAAREGGA